MNNLVLDKKFTTSINFFDNILFLDSIINNKNEYNMSVNYLKKDNYYILKLNILENETELINTECKLTNKINGSIVIKNIINLVTDKYNNDLIINVKEIDEKNNCIKFGKRIYKSKNNE